MGMLDQINNRLTEAFAPESLEIVDESHLHEGHAGARPGGETHFRVRIVSAAFEGLTLVNRHRLVNKVLSDELKGSIHALAMKTLTPEEAKASTNS